MEVLVQKFGGTSVASYEKMKEVCKIIEAHKEKYKDIAVVVSAMGRKGAPYATDTLIGMCTNINDRPTKRELDMIMSCGEIISGTILATMLDSMGIPATFLTGTQAGIITTKAFSNAKIKKIKLKYVNIFLHIILEKLSFVFILILFIFPCFIFSSTSFF